MQRVHSASPDLEDLSSKRKRAGNDNPDGARKRKRKRRTWETAGRDIDSENSVNRSLALMGPAQIADLLAQQSRRFQADLSALEMEEMRIPTKAIYDTTSYTLPRLTEKLPAFLRHLHSHRPDSTALDTAPEAKGTPHTLLVTSASLRAADLVRVLRVFQNKNSHVAKLFAKHIKLNDAIASIKKTRIGIGVGTPGRMIELLDEKALEIGSLERVVVDFSRIDGKTRGILDTKEAQEPLMKLLSRPELKDRFESGDVDLVFY